MVSEPPRAPCAGTRLRIKIRAAAGDRSFDVEYSPGVTSEEELKRMLQTFSDALARTPDRARAFSLSAARRPRRRG
jgi:hypothetical protein